MSARSARACVVRGRMSRTTSLAHVTAASRRSSRSAEDDERVPDEGSSSEGSDPERASTATTSQKRSPMNAGSPIPGSNLLSTAETHRSDSSRVLIRRARAFGLASASFVSGSDARRITPTTGKRMKSRDRSMTESSIVARDAPTAARWLTVSSAASSETRRVAEPWNAAKATSDVAPSSPMAPPAANSGAERSELARCSE